MAPWVQERVPKQGLGARWEDGEWRGPRGAGHAPQCGRALGPRGGGRGGGTGRGLDASGRGAERAFVHRVPSVSRRARRPASLQRRPRPARIPGCGRVRWRAEDPGEGASPSWRPSDGRAPRPCPPPGRCRRGPGPAGRGPCRSRAGRGRAGRRREARPPGQEAAGGGGRGGARRACLGASRPAARAGGTAGAKRRRCGGLCGPRNRRSAQRAAGGVGGTKAGAGAAADRAWGACGSRCPRSRAPPPGRPHSFPEPPPAPARVLPGLHLSAFKRQGGPGASSSWAERRRAPGALVGWAPGMSQGDWLCWAASSQRSAASPDAPRQAPAQAGHWTQPHSPGGPAS